MTIVFFLFLLMMKHYICDYWLQNDKMISGKGSFKQIGGYQHVGWHGLGTLLVFMYVFIGLIQQAVIFWMIFAFTIVVFDMVVHYVIDYTKANLTDYLNKIGYRGDFTWQLHGVDQAMHCFTYYIIVVFTTRFIEASLAL